MSNYVALSLELNLFFLRIMKEHSLFLESGFLAKEESLIKRSQRFRENFEQLLRETVSISNGAAGQSALDSHEIVTPVPPGNCHTAWLPGEYAQSAADIEMQKYHSFLQNEAHPPSIQSAPVPDGLPCGDDGNVLEPDYDGTCMVYPGAAGSL